MRDGRWKYDFCHPIGGLFTGKWGSVYLETGTVYREIPVCLPGNQFCLPGLPGLFTRKSDLFTGKCRSIYQETGLFTGKDGLVYQETPHNMP